MRIKRVITATVIALSALSLAGGSIAASAGGASAAAHPYVYMHT